VKRSARETPGRADGGGQLQIACGSAQINPGMRHPLGSLGWRFSRDGGVTIRSLDGANEVNKPCSVRALWYHYSVLKPLTPIAGGD